MGEYKVPQELNWRDTERGSTALPEQQLLLSLSLPSSVGLVDTPSDSTEYSSPMSCCWSAACSA